MRGHRPSSGTRAARALAVSLHRSVGQASIKRRNAFDPTIRLDLMQNPYGPCPAAIEAVETCQEFPPELARGHISAAAS